ncbi:hypothetical protein K474DRAFT_1659436 [Panus rudis PR-1116 ss-1]|nr:hypothetical protein K474DRAFT_1659436 [Panus rudis PR-1116 ss-1]
MPSVYLVHSPFLTFSQEKQDCKSAVTCDKCGLGLASRGDAQRHESIHTDYGRWFYCSWCGWLERQKSNVKGHEKRRHIACGEPLPHTELELTEAQFLELLEEHKRRVVSTPRYKSKNAQGKQRRRKDVDPSSEEEDVPLAKTARLATAPYPSRRPSAPTSSDFKSRPVQWGNNRKRTWLEIVCNPM